MGLKLTQGFVFQIILYLNVKMNILYLFSIIKVED
jgi:hypothetical protein